MTRVPYYVVLSVSSPLHASLGFRIIWEERRGQVVVIVMKLSTTFLLNLMIASMYSPKLDAKLVCGIGKENENQSVDSPIHRSSALY